jgi:hypothetical protein
MAGNPLTLDNAVTTTRMPAKGAPMEKKICRMILSHRGKDAAHRDVDLLLQDGQPPTAVLEWADYPDGTSIPSVALQLDPKFLHPLPDSWLPVTHLYEQQMDSPIPLPRP